MDRTNTIFFCVLFILCVGCDDNFIPKPKGFNRISLPSHKYQILPDTFPYSLEYSVHASILPDTSWIAEKYWISIYYKVFDASLQLTYKPILKKNAIEEMIADSYKLTSQHTIKAYSIEEKILEYPNGQMISYSELEGEVPTPIQFHMTDLDSTSHFLRGAFYFNTATKNDSLAPVIDYIKRDIFHMFNTLNWKE